MPGHRTVLNLWSRFVGVTKCNLTECKRVMCSRTSQVGSLILCECIAKFAADSVYDCGADEEQGIGAYTMPFTSVNLPTMAEAFKTELGRHPSFLHQSLILLLNACLACQHTARFMGIGYGPVLIYHLLCFVNS